MIDGQARTSPTSAATDVSVEECLEMEGNKTGALLACACSIGAVLGGADDRRPTPLEAYGYHLGLAFQAVDDLLGIWGDPVADRQADLERPAPAQEVAAGRAALAAGGPACRRLGELLAADAKQRVETSPRRSSPPAPADRGGRRPRTARAPAGRRDRGPRRVDMPRSAHSSWRSRTLVVRKR